MTRSTSSSRRELLEIDSRRGWRAWLEGNHRSKVEIWLVFPKGPTTTKGFSYEDAVEEALCFGWIDSIVRGLDDDRYARKFTPRNADSRWSTINRQRYARVAAQGLLADAGRQRAPTLRSGDAPRPSLSALPGPFADALDASPKARSYFEQLAPSYRRAFIAWIEAAKRDETKAKRVREAIDLLKAGRKLGLK